MLKAQAFMLYIYFVSNKDNYYFALSPTAIQSEIGMPRSTFYDQLKKLESLGFLEKDAKGYYHFYEVPKVYSNEKVSATEILNADNGNGYAENGDGCTENNIEINNKYNK